LKSWQRYCKFYRKNFKNFGKRRHKCKASFRSRHKEVPPPTESLKQDFRALIFDSEYDSFKGVIAFVRVIDGEISNGEKIELMATKTSAEVKELGYLNPTFSAKKKLKLAILDTSQPELKSREK